MLPYIAWVATWQALVELTNENLSLLWGGVPRKTFPRTTEWEDPAERVPEVRAPVEQGAYQEDCCQP